MINLYINTVQSQKNRKNLVYHIFRLNDFLIGLDGVILDETVIKNLILKILTASYSVHTHGNHQRAICKTQGHE
jgi:hypothetical protein